MPARRNFWSFQIKPQGSIISKGTFKHALRRINVPVFCGISGWYKASLMLSPNYLNNILIFIDYNNFDAACGILTHSAQAVGSF
jgi:hypothetical protein